MVFGCILNARLVQAGFCPKHLCDMNDAEMVEYYRLIAELHTGG